MATICFHCDRRIVFHKGYWIDPLAIEDDRVWRETCDAHDTRVAEHQPPPKPIADIGNDSPACDVCGEDKARWQFEWVATCDDCTGQA